MLCTLRIVVLCALKSGAIFSGGGCPKRRGPQKGVCRKGGTTPQTLYVATTSKIPQNIFMQSSANYYILKFCRIVYVCNPFFAMANNSPQGTESFCGRWRAHTHTHTQIWHCIFAEAHFSDFPLRPTLALVRTLSGSL